MKSLLFTLALAVGASFVLSGCDDDIEAACKEVCGDEDRCDADTITEAACGAACENRSRIAEFFGCESEMLPLVECQNAAEDRCGPDGPTGCDDQLAAYTTCVEAYCAEHPDDTSNCLSE